MNSYRHIYLYAKGWYIKTEIIHDLKIILSHRCGIETQYITIQDIFDVLTPLIFESINKSSNPEYFFTELMGDILPSNRWKIGCEITDNLEIVILKKYLSILKFVDIKLIDKDLGEPDPNILPLKEK